MSDFMILILILILVVCLLVTVVGFVLYSGLLAEVVVRTGSPPVRNLIIAYKFREGPYRDSGAGYTESCSIGPRLSCIGIFYDDPKQRPAEQCRYAVGSILSEGEQAPDPELRKLYEKHGFRVFSLPEVTHAVTSSFPSTTPLSHVLGPYRVHSELSAYIEERKLSAYPTVEVCRDEQTLYMVPLDRQTEFFVPEMREETKTELREDDSEEDRGTDITGADSHSDVSSGSSGAQWDGTPLPASTAASLASASLASASLDSAPLGSAPLGSALPLRELADGEERLLGDQDSDKSLGSGSSFEELDMEQGEGRAEEEEEEGEEEEEEEEELEGAAGGAVEKALEHGAEGAAEHEKEKREPSGDGAEE